MRGIVSGIPRLAVLAALTLAAATAAGAQQPTAPGMTLAQAVASALHNYPSIRVSEEQAKAAAAGIQLARTAYLPRVDMLAQVNRATRNNVFGMLLPQSVVPAISGPVLGTNNLGTAWGSAVGTLVTWEPFDFGLRGANEAAAAAARTRSEAAVKRTEFEVASAAADAYLTLVAAQETVRAANAGVERAETSARVIRAQADAQLRPGADASRAEAELAAARTQAIQAGRTVDIARVNLAQFVGTEPGAIAVAASALLAAAPDQPVAPLNLAANPLSVEQSAVVEQLTAQLRALGRSYFPHFALQAAAFARGTGAQVNGNNLGGLNGLAPSTHNYGLGFSVTFPLFDFPAIRAREAAQSAAVRAETARSQQIATELKARWNAAVATLEGARRVAVNTPVQVSAARAASDQAMARYQSGLGNIEAVADAQRLLTQAEIDDALARLGVWRALLGVAIAAGDIEPFVAEAGR